MEFGFVGPTYQNESIRADCQRAMNWYPERIESGTGKVKWVLHRTPGLQLFTTLPQSPIRGLWAGHQRLFAAAGDRLYEVTSGGGYIDRGGIGNDGLPVQMFPNGNQLYVVSAGRAYVDNGAGAVGCTFTGGSTPVTASRGAFLDGYFIAVEPNSRKLFISGLYDGTKWDALDFGAKEAYPDYISSILADHEELWVFGMQNTTEVWRHTGAADFPFERDPGAFIHFGLAAPASPVRLAGGVAWLAWDTDRGGPMAMHAVGFSPQRVSTHSVEYIWSTYSTVQDAISYSYIENGHHFWVVSFPSGNATWVYDATTQMWHERGAWGGFSFGRHPAAHHAYVGIGPNATPKHYVGDWQTGRIYIQARSITTDNGAAIRRVRTAPHVSNENLRLFFSRLTLDFDLPFPTPISPILDWSNDGGYTWSTPRTVVTSSSYKARAIWNRLGSARDRVFRLTLNETSDVSLLNAYLAVDGGNG